MTFEYLASPDFAIGCPPSAIRSYTDARDTAQVTGMLAPRFFCPQPYLWLDIASIVIVFLALVTEPTQCLQIFHR